MHKPSPKKKNPPKTPNNPKTSKAPTTANPRDAAYTALLEYEKNGTFIQASLKKWKLEQNPSKVDFSLAQEIANGTIRMVLALDYIAIQLSDKKKISLKKKEKILLRTAIYQHYYMDRVPLYAIVNETVKIAKKMVNPSFPRFINHLLRKLETSCPLLPQGDSTENLNVTYSQPLFFIKHLLASYPLPIVHLILKTSNTAPSLMARVIKELSELPEKTQIVFETPLEVIKLLESNTLQKLIHSSNYYIQNVTPVALISDLYKHAKNPHKILDLCASPGGKTVALHDLFPNAELFCNDVSNKKIEKLKENLDKYSITATLSTSLGEAFSSDNLFDLIIIDAPCSNSGVLNKRPEARWRLTKEHLNELTKTQDSLIENAKQYLSPEGQIWYMTCSILPEENEERIKNAHLNFGLETNFLSKKILPNHEGWDGGFACILTKK